MKTDLKWLIRYYKLVKEVSLWSKDPSAKIGAIIVGDKNQIISQGYNGFPRGMSDSYERYQNREQKYKFVVHAEANAICNALYNGSSVEGSTLLVYGLPVCNECAKLIIQSGIKNVIIFSNENEKWDEIFNITRIMFSECNIDVQRYSIFEMEKLLKNDSLL